jgi:hypothetical protein
MDSDDKLMMEVMQEDEAEAAAHLQRWNMGSAFLFQLRQQQMANVVPRRGGSVCGKAPNKDRSRNAGALLLYSDYFADNAINTPKEFRRRFRMNKDLFMKIVQGVREYDDYFKYKKDCTRKWGFTLFRNARPPYGALCMELRRILQWTMYERLSRHLRMVPSFVGQLSQCLVQPI